MLDYAAFVLLALSIGLASLGVQLLQVLRSLRYESRALADSGTGRVLSDLGKRVRALEERNDKPHAH